MFFRNLSLYRFGPDVVIEPGAFATILAEHPLRDVGPVELETSGFVSPIAREGALTLTIGAHTLFALGTQERILPASVIADELAHRVAQIREREDRNVGGKERKRIKEDIYTEFLPRAFTRTRKTLAYIDAASGWLVIDTSSRAPAETVISRLRDALGSFPATPLTPDESPRMLLTSWMVTGVQPQPVALGEDCELRDPAEEGATVRCARQDLQSDEVIEHLRCGKQVFRLGLSYDDRMTFTLGEDLSIKKLRFTDVIADQVRDAESNEEEAQQSFTLMSLELAQLFEWIDATFKTPRAATIKLDGGAAPKHMRDAEKMAASPEIVRALSKIAPKPGSGITSISLSIPGSGKPPAVLTQADGARLRKIAARLDVMPRAGGAK